METTPDVSQVRRNTLLLTSGAIIAAVLIFIRIMPDFVHFSPQIAREVQSNFFIFTPSLTVLFLGTVLVYLRPIHQFIRSLNQGQQPPPSLAQQARTRAFNAPFHLFFALIVLVGLSAVFVNLYGLATQPGYAFALHISYSLLITATSTAIALIFSTLMRRILRPILIATADLAQDIGHRYEIRLRLTFVVISLNFIVFYFLGVLTFNMVYRAAREGSAELFQQWQHDLRQIAPHLDDESLLTIINDADILSKHQATLALSDAQGNYVIAPPDAHQLPSTPQATHTPVEQNGHFTLAFPIERESDPWQLSVAYTLEPQDMPIVRNTLLVLLVFGSIMLVLALVTTHYLADDITRDVKYVTARLLDIARRGYVGEAMPTLSLDEVGDLIAAFDKVREAVTQQQNELNRRVGQMHQLHQASLALASSVDFEQMLDRICQVARDITASDTVTLYLYNPINDAFVHASQTGYQDSPGPVGHIRAKGMTRTVLNSRQSILVQDTHKHPLVSPSVIEHNIRSMVAVPVISRAQAMGVLYVNSHQLNAYDDEDVQIVSALASQAAAAIENARLLDETRDNARTLERRARNLLMINRIAADLTSHLNPYDIFNATAKHLVQLMEVDHCSVTIFDEESTRGVIVAGYPDIGAVGQPVSRTTNGAIEKALATRKPLAVEDIYEEPLLVPVRGTLAEIGIRATLVAPLIARDEVMGVLNLDVLHKSRRFTNEEQELCSTIAAQAAIAASNARLLYDLQQQSRALTRKSQELAEESAKMDAVLTNMADGLVVTDLAGRIMVSNPAFQIIAGLPASRSLRGRLLDETLSLSGLREAIAAATADLDQVAVSNLEMPDGRVLKASASALHMQQAADPTLEGQMTGVVTLLRDITHEVEVDRMKTEFISAVSHELRTPLTSILGFANLIQRDFRRRIVSLIPTKGSTRRASDRILENLNIIEAESQRLTQLINDVLDIAKIESGRVEWNMNNVDLTNVIHSSINATAVLAHEKGLALQTTIPGTLPLIWGDQDRLVQVMTNLLSNAIKFTDEGKIAVNCWGWDEESSPPPHSRARRLEISSTDRQRGRHWHWHGTRRNSTRL